MSFDTIASATNPAFLAALGGTVQVLKTGLPTVSYPAIINTDSGYQNIAGVGMVSAEPSIVMLTTDAANVTATATIRIAGVDWTRYGDPINHGTGMTTLNLIRP